MTKKFHVLLVDDDINDRLLFAAALEGTGLEVHLFETESGFAAMNYLLGTRVYNDRTKFPLPDIVFLDLKMPVMDGFAVLKEIRSRPELKNLPVIILSNSNLMEDQKHAFALGAKAFHSKPIRLKDLTDLLRRVLMPGKDGSDSASERKSHRT